jgi:hypothetical protein
MQILILKAGCSTCGTQTKVPEHQPSAIWFFLN